MLCPRCNESSTRVIDSRDLEGGGTIRRRRECEQCAYRFTTYERPEGARLTVIKRDGGRQEFDRAKLQAGLMRALEKRPVVRLQQAKRGLIDVGRAVPLLHKLARVLQLQLAVVGSDDVEDRRADLLVAFGFRIELHCEEIGFGERAALGEQVVDALRAQRPPKADRGGDPSRAKQRDRLAGT